VILGLEDTIIAEDIDHAIELTGGMGKFHVLAFLSIVSGMISGAYFLYSLPYFEK
jgi:hypothetical protein